ncbi:hypothetical protein BO82DRAFT_388354 [Aspergillus uvarum CBS 121591]|uniref:Uncharacterized protein n=1 Tax=Aspergillus uvarum CBS 121591 TaxID=1448315 RepID=A0A319CW37_9EURO|nr:hypothetical protein BO82DRAFT_388354 [Aspergillus uvarum CBS 121591]PYH86717.1 hypothetical protein BO82DRAFT_388354 [Aspergillus uvarum CBS 121591]
MHSYGGIVGTEAIPEDLTHAARHAQGHNGGVLHLFYFAGVILSKGQSVLGTFGESPNNDVQPDGKVRLKNGTTIIYSDLPAEEGALWESRRVPQSYAMQTTCSTRAAYEYFPSTYLVCEGD